MSNFNFNDITSDTIIICRDGTDWSPVEIVKNEYIFAVENSPFPSKERRFFFKDYKEGYLDLTISSPTETKSDIIKICKEGLFNTSGYVLYENNTGLRWTPAEDVLPNKSDLYNILYFDRFGKLIENKDYYTIKNDDWFETHQGEWFSFKDVRYWKKGE